MPVEVTEFLLCAALQAVAAGDVVPVLSVRPGLVEVVVAHREAFRRRQEIWAPFPMILFFIFLASFLAGLPFLLPLLRLSPSRAWMACVFVRRAIYIARY